MKQRELSSGHVGIVVRLADAPAARRRDSSEGYISLLIQGPSFPHVWKGNTNMVVVVTEAKKPLSGCKKLREYKVVGENAAEEAKT